MFFDVFLTFFCVCVCLFYSSFLLFFDVQLKYLIVGKHTKTKIHEQRKSRRTNHEKSSKTEWCHEEQHREKQHRENTNRETKNHRKKKQKSRLKLRNAFVDYVDVMGVGTSHARMMLKFKYPRHMARRLARGKLRFELRSRGCKFKVHQERVDGFRKCESPTHRERVDGFPE